jgi:signal transduction histidine kinase
VLWRTRLRLALWSGGTTLVVVLILGAIVYAFVAQQIARDSEDQLRARAALVAELRDPRTEAGSADGLGLVATAAKAGVLFGGPLSGTIAITAEKELSGAAQAISAVDDGPAAKLAAKEEALAFKESIAKAAVETGSSSADGQLTLKEIDGVPTRIISLEAGTPDRPYVVHALADRTIELRTLTNLAAALLLAGALAVFATAAAGWVYSGRALVPIRASLRRQREFAADASHELRTPLTVVRNNLELLSRQRRDDALDREALGDATSEAERMSRLVDDLLVLARSDAGAAPIERVELDLAEATLGAVDGMTEEAERRSVSVELDLAQASMRGDPGRLRQLATILVDNAVRHGHKGGHVWVRVRPAAGRAELIVADDGPGVRAEHRGDVFERFWRAPTARTSGSGLGLAIAHWIVEAHDGTIDCDERPGGGARFIVALPL